MCKEKIFTWPKCPQKKVEYTGEYMQTANEAKQKQKALKKLHCKKSANTQRREEKRNASVDKESVRLRTVCDLLK